MPKSNLSDQISEKVKAVLSNYGVNKSSTTTLNHMLPYYEIYSVSQGKEKVVGRAKILQDGKTVYLDFCTKEGMAHHNTEIYTHAMFMIEQTIDLLNGLATEGGIISMEIDLPQYIGTHRIYKRTV